MKIESDAAARAIVYGEPRIEDEIGELDTTMEEWRAALQPPLDDPGFTIIELLSKLDIPETTLKRKILELERMGKCITGKATREDRLGRSYEVTVYQLIGEEK